jgi:hypothetical protein
MIIFKRIEINLAKNILISVTVEFWQKFEGLRYCPARWIQPKTRLIPLIFIKGSVAAAF